ncbi:bacteriophage abortive infection AbiH family protein [Agrobacterium rosae]|uniref:Bacteriophage abortive infection AbiH family protein n=1 Tax=Agrobacterium rosae TaxID=1972867 RepID=A0AAW9FN02_9HYPH|nr:bacteriophage abortive infection AbiH family protein [Agrobacterium rosae]MDX8304315.1 bacteriophage abortive infection AbiH family protein [Agrobacterium rosae]
MTKLFIIGNGFDIHHGIRSRYTDFAEWLESVDHEVHSAVEEFLPTWVDAEGNVQNAWADLENNLQYFDTDQLLDYGMNFLPSYGADDWRDSGHHDFEYELDRVIRALSVGLHRNFVRWLGTLSIPIQTTFPVRSIAPRAKFLNFNYTPTIQTLYGAANVLHIHGSLADPTSQIVLGHGWTPGDDDRWEDRIDEDTDTRVAGGYRLIDDYFRETFKPTAEIIQRNRAFFAGLGDVSEVYVFGHGLAEVDAPYFAEMLEYLPEDVDWIISYYGGHREREKIEAAAIEIGIATERTRFAFLSDL